MSVKWPGQGPAPYAFSITGPARDSNAPAPPAVTFARNSRREIPSIWLSLTAVALLSHVPVQGKGPELSVTAPEPACRVDFHLLPNRKALFCSERSLFV